MSAMYGFLKDQHYIWDSGLSGHVVYAPKGKNLRNKLEEYLRYVLRQQLFDEIESPLIYKKEVWQKSGHWERFQDPIVWTQNKKCFRLDKLLEEIFNVKFEKLSWEEVTGLLIQINTKQFIKDPIIIKTEVEWKSLMMKTMSSHQEVGLRPETATATYQNFEDNFYFKSKQYPIKVFQIGKSFRNEIATRHNLIRGREFTQLEAQIILPNEMKKDNLIDVDVTGILNINLNDDMELITLSWDQFKEKCNLDGTYFQMLFLIYQLFLRLGLKPESLRLRQHMDNEKAFYALDAWDLEINLKEIGWTEIAGLHDRGQYDLEKVITGKLKKKGIPHVLEMAIGIDRLFYSILDNLFEKKDVQEGKSMLTIPYFLAPVQISVLPLVKNLPELCVMGKDVYHRIRQYFVTEYDDRGGIGKRYLKNAIKGVPYSLTVDHDSLINNDVTVRDRNTEEQVRVKIDSLVGYMFQKLAMNFC
jgi:glycyl-tRNA synthetase